MENEKPVGWAASNSSAKLNTDTEREWMFSLPYVGGCKH